MTCPPSAPVLLGEPAVGRGFGPEAESLEDNEFRVDGETGYF
ncbi:MAG: hypothetical protein ACRCXL_02335 [Dermatophilaceae bacterium]